MSETIANRPQRRQVAKQQQSEQIERHLAWMMRAGRQEMERMHAERGQEQSQSQGQNKSRRE